MLRIRHPLNVRIWTPASFIWRSPELPAVTSLSGFHPKSSNRRLCSSIQNIAAVRSSRSKHCPAATPCASMDDSINKSATSASSNPVAIKQAVKHKHSVSDIIIVFMDKDAVTVAAATAKIKQRASVDFVPD